MSSTESMATPALPTSPEHALVVRIVAAMRRQVEGHRETLLSGRQIAPVEGVRLFRGGESSVLADGPRLHRVHRGVRSAQKWRHAGRVLQVLHGVEIVGRVPGASPECARPSSRPASPPPGPADPPVAAAGGSRSSRSPVSLAAPHAQLSCHSVRVCDGIAEDVNEALHPGGLQGFHLFLRIAGHQHRHLDVGADFLRERQVLGVGAAQNDQVRVRAPRTPRLPPCRSPRSRRS